MKKYIAALMVVFLTLLTSCAYETNNVVVSGYTGTAPDNTEHVPKNKVDSPKLMFSDNDSAERPSSNEAITIQDLFEPKDTEIYLEGIPHPVRIYPFGDIVKSAAEGRASFVIFIEANQNVEQHDNLLRIIPNIDMSSDRPPVFMEITQVTDTTVAELESQIKSDIDFNSHLYAFHMTSTEDFPFNIIEFHEDVERDSKVTRIFIRDNEHGGVFVITAQFFSEAIGGFGAHYKHYISTLKIIDTE